MTDKFITELDVVTDFDDNDLLVLETNPDATAETNSITVSNWVSNYLKRTNYQITRTVSSNNLTVAVKNSSGSDPSTDEPLTFNINGNMRKISSALSITVNAGANVFNLGATEFANLPQELFLYVGWRASDSSVFPLLSRIPYAKEYADFHVTNTNERYGAFTGSTPAGTDAVTVIGRVNVQNSGTASYNWSIPTANTIIHRPIFRTSWLSWTPTLVGFSSNPTSPVYLYMLDNNTVTLFVRHGGNGTSNANNFTLSLPFTAKTITNMVWGGAGGYTDNGVVAATPAALRIQSAATTLEVAKTWDGNFTSWTTSGGKRVNQMNPIFYEMGI